MARRPPMVLDLDNVRYRPYINTLGNLDIVNGKYLPTTSGGWALSGGLGHTTAVIATANRFKSALLQGSCVNALARYPDSIYVNYCSEFSTSDVYRLANMSSLYREDPVKRERHIIDLVERMRLLDPTTDEARSLDAIIDFVKTIRDDKIKHIKDYEVETDIIDPNTGKPYRMIIPTLVGIDSWTEATVEHLIMLNEKHDADTEMKDQRTINMDEGWQKTRLMRQLPRIAAQAGIYFFISGHLGKKTEMGAKPSQKEMAYMSQEEITKGMGPKFNFLMSSIWKISNTSPLTDKNDRNETEYPIGASVSNTELQEIFLTLIRCKNKNSGSQTRIISSQSMGLLPGLSSFHYLRMCAGYFGIGGASSPKSVWMPEVSLQRKKVFGAMQDYRMERAMELTYQHAVIQKTWSLINQPVDYGITPEKLVDELGKTTGAVSEILETRGWWSYGPQERHHMTLPDVLAIVSNNYKPKWFQVGSAK